MGGNLSQYSEESISVYRIWILGDIYLSILNNLSQCTEHGFWVKSIFLVILCLCGRILYLFGGCLCLSSSCRNPRLATYLQRFVWQKLRPLLFFSRPQNRWRIPLVIMKDRLGLSEDDSRPSPLALIVVQDALRLGLSADDSCPFLLVFIVVGEALPLCRWSIVPFSSSVYIKRRSIALGSFRWPNVRLSVGVQGSRRSIALWSFRWSIQRLSADVYRSRTGIALGSFLRWIISFLVVVYSSERSIALWSFRWSIVRLSAGDDRNRRSFTLGSFRRWIVPSSAIVGELKWVDVLRMGLSDDESYPSLVVIIWLQY